MILFDVDVFIFVLFMFSLFSSFDAGSALFDIDIQKADLYATLLSGFGFAQLITHCGPLHSASAFQA